MATTTLTIHEVLITNQKKENQDLRDFDNGSDLHKFLCEQLRNWNTGSETYEILKDEVNEKLLRVKDDFFEPLNNRVQGVVESGAYGEDFEITDDLGKKAHRQRKNQAPMKPFYFCFYLPKNCNKGYFVLQSFKGRGVKTVLSHELKNTFKRVHPDFVLRIRPIVQKEIIQEILKSPVTEIVFRNTLPNQPVDVFADEGAVLPELKTEYVIRTKWKADSLYYYNTIKGFFKKREKKTDLLVVNGFEYNELDVLVTLNGKERKVRLHKLEDMPAVYDISNKVKIGIDGFPEVEAVKREVLDLMNDIIEHQNNEN